MMNQIGLKEENAAFYFNQAELNLKALEKGIFDKKRKEDLFENPAVLKKVENFVFNFRDVALDAKNEIDNLLLKLVELRNYYSHYVHTGDVFKLSKGERPLLEKYYQIAIEATKSKAVKLEIIEGDNRLTEAGVLFLLCMFLKKSQANKLISSVSGFKRTDADARPRRNLFTYYSVREGYKVVPDMEKHFLLFALVNHLSNQDDYIENSHGDSIGEGAFFHRIASTFLNVSGILDKMEFYAYQSKRLEDQRGKPEPEEGCFNWVEPFGRNSYFSLDGDNGVIGENQLKELCYVLLVEEKNIDIVEDKIKQFLEKFKKADNEQMVEADNVLDRNYFPANYFEQSRTLDIKQKILCRLKKKAESCGRKTDRAYDKMREVLEFINNRLPAGGKLKQKDYRRYLKLVRFWGKERNNVKREFDSKGWSGYLPSEFWQAKTLEDTYKFSKEQNKKIIEKLKSKVSEMNEGDFEKYRKINNAKDIRSLKELSRDFGLEWNEKDWEEYSRQIKKRIDDRQKLTIMKQRVTAELKRQQGIENLNLRISFDIRGSRQAVLNRIAVPNGFVKKHILGTDKKVSRQIRESQCLILLSNKYDELSKSFFDKYKRDKNNDNLDKMTQVNGLYEKNKLIAFMIVYLMKQLGLKLNSKIRLNELKQTPVNFKLSEKVTVDIQLLQYPSLTYILNNKYIDSVNDYKFSSDEKGKSITDKIDIIEKARLEFIRQVLGFEKYLFDKKIIEKSQFTDNETHISFSEICSELTKKGWETGKLKDMRNNALHGGIPREASFSEGVKLVEKLKKQRQ